MSSTNSVPIPSPALSVAARSSVKIELLVKLAVGGTKELLRPSVTVRGLSCRYLSPLFFVMLGDASKRSAPRSPLALCDPLSAVSCDDCRSEDGSGFASMNPISSIKGAIDLFFFLRSA